ncbi:MAG: aminotransferase class V-fold PLP-dependent enzyme [Bacteroidales bacterium]|nr:aminotransferase class V-fold PLP-dependent enzyme [Bacteroidales bacterium]
MSSLESYFSTFRKNIVGIDSSYQTPYGKKKIVYLDWVASGRLYKPIEDKLQYDFGPFVANTHTETSETGSRMTHSYHHAHETIKGHVNAGPEDIIITAGSGMTSVVNKLQRILGLKSGKKYKSGDKDMKNRPVVFITHMEHHSNQTSWYETIADVVVLQPDKNLLVNLEELNRKLKDYRDRRFKIGAFTACSNVTGITTPYHEMAEIMHRNNGLCFIDFAASAPYVGIDMCPSDPMQRLDAIYFSPHKFLGGPGSSGVLVFDSSLYNSEIPDDPGGGTVDWTNPWGEYKYVDDIEAREDGGTPGFLQAIRAALALNLKEKMNVQKILEREEELVNTALEGIRGIPGIKILAGNVVQRLGIVSFCHEKIHFNLIVKLLSDRFGIQARGGCACAGTYGHYLLELSYNKSHEITEKISHGDLSEKPGWVRISMHPTMTDRELFYFLDSLKEIVRKYDKWKKDYIYNPKKNEFEHISMIGKTPSWLRTWFEL